MSKNASAELISKVLYPNDNHVEGKILRLRQQYFLYAASIGDIVQNHLATYGTLENLADKVAIQLNDTHPTLAIPEMMRILLDECGFGWDKAFEICHRTSSPTPTTPLWPRLWRSGMWTSSSTTLPRIYQIVVEMNRRAREKLEAAFPGDEGKINYMRPHRRQSGAHGQHLRLHLQQHQRRLQAAQRDHQGQRLPRLLPVQPQQFKNVTNGIAYRRWLLASNPELCKLLDETIGDGYKHDAPT